MWSIERSALDLQHCIIYVSQNSFPQTSYTFSGQDRKLLMKGNKEKFVFCTGHRKNVKKKDVY
jgi:hypothetical protein